MAWQFADSLDTGVYTTRQVIVDGELLSLVSHDVDGDWQFLHDEAGEDDELRDPDHLLFVHFSDVVARFPEVEQLADLPRGWMAWREAAADPWVREPQPEGWADD